MTKVNMRTFPIKTKDEYCHQSRHAGQWIRMHPTKCIAGDYMIFTGQREADTIPQGFQININD